MIDTSIDSTSEAKNYDEICDNSIAEEESSERNTHQESSPF